MVLEQFTDAANSSIISLSYVLERYLIKHGKYYTYILFNCYQFSECFNSRSVINSVTNNLVCLNRQILKTAASLNYSNTSQPTIALVN